MNRIRSAAFALALAPLSLRAAAPLPDIVAPESARVLTADKPASNWTNGYPVGNGVMGGLNLGAYPKETVVLNHDALWSKPKRHELPADCRKADMDAAFAKAMAGDYAGAQNLYCKAKNKGNGVGTFQTLGALTVEHLDAPAKVSAKILRKLDLRTGESVATATLADGVVTETLLASFPDKCVAVKIESTRPGGLNVRLALSRPGGLTDKGASFNSVFIKGDTGGTRFYARAQAYPTKGGIIICEENSIRITGTSSVVVFVACSTDYNRDEPRTPHPVTDGDLEGKTREIIDKAADTSGFDTVRARAAADHARLMDRCTLDFGKTDPAVAKLTTPERMALLKKGGKDPDLLETYFQFGRHMLISSSREGGLPPNLQGLWEAGMSAAWNGDFHLNINVQMNLWPATVTGLTECNEPYFALLKMLRKHGAETAASLGCRGYTAGLASDAWGHADFCGGSAEWDSYILGGAWAQEHLMEHYRFTRDKAFLRDTAWPVLRDGALFMLDWMREDPATGKLIAGPGSSPENAFRYTDAQGKQHGANIAVGNTHDHELAWEVFSDTLEAAKILGIHDDLTDRVSAALKRTPSPAIGTDGRIMEWYKPFGEVWLGHRHKSHLYGLFPGRQITLTGTPELAAAAEKSLAVRMDPKHAGSDPSGHTGWNLAWSANLWARLHRGDRALATVEEQLRTQVNENLFNRCGGPFQIDGNLGTPAAMAEMLLQSHEAEADGTPTLRLLPALPKDWSDGSARGLRARGGIVVDMDWTAGRVTRAVLRGEAGETAKIRVEMNGKTREFVVPAGGSIEAPAK